MQSLIVDLQLVDRQSHLLSIDHVRSSEEGKHQILGHLRAVLISENGTVNMDAMRCEKAVLGI